MKITKETLRKLQAQRGKRDTDSGKRFDGFIGRLVMSDRLYHGDVQLSDILPGEEITDSFMLSAILERKSERKRVKPNGDTHNHSDV